MPKKQRNVRWSILSQIGKNTEIWNYVVKSNRNSQFYLLNRSKDSHLI